MNVKSRNMLEVVLQIIFLLCLFLQFTSWGSSFVDIIFDFVALAILALFAMQARAKERKAISFT